MTDRDPEWSDVRIFLAIARAGTLGAAAKRVGQTQPTMGRRLRALEAALGQTLFQRTRDGFVLTTKARPYSPTRSEWKKKRSASRARWRATTPG